MTVSVMVMDSPVGPLRLVSEGAALKGLSFVDDAVTAPLASGQVEPLLVETSRQLTAYFDGRLKIFDLPLALTGTEFQQRVWTELRRIPFGTTASYGGIAAALGMKPGAARAVGLANGANPVAIVVPCHRVIGSNGKLIGFAGGLHRKRRLLEFEATEVQDTLFS